MDIISYNEGSTANGRIEKFNANPDSNSGVLTQPKVIEAGETVTIKSGRQAILTDMVVEGDLVIEAGADVSMLASIVPKSLEDIIDTLDSSIVKLTGNQTISGVKTFASSPIVPTPTTNFQVATKKYVDDVMGGGAGTGGGSGLSIEDKAKLDDIEEEATKNETDAFLLSRSNHTGTIPMSVVENLEQELANISICGGSVYSFKGRTGDISPNTGDYASDMITETTKKQFVSKDEKISWNNRVTDAASNGKLYGRKNGEWVEIVSSGGDTNAEIVAITNKLDAKGVEANKVLVSNGDDTSEWKDYNTYSYTESEIAPLNPKLGDDWRDTASGKLYKWSSVGGVAEWSEIGSGSSSGGFNPDNDIMLSAGKGVVMTSGNGTVYKLYIDNDGRLTTEVM